MKPGKSYIFWMGINALIFLIAIPLVIVTSKYAALSIYWFNPFGGLFSLDAGEGFFYVIVLISGLILGSFVGASQIFAIEKIAGRVNRPRWIGACVLWGTLGYFAVEISNDLGYLWGVAKLFLIRIPFLILAGVSIGFLQWLDIRKYFKGHLGWIISNFIAGIVFFPILWIFVITLNLLLYSHASMNAGIHPFSAGTILVVLSIGGFVGSWIGIFYGGLGGLPFLWMRRLPKRRTLKPNI